MLRTRYVARPILVEYGRGTNKVRREAYFSSVLSLYKVRREAYFSSVWSLYKVRRKAYFSSVWSLYKVVESPVHNLSDP